MAMENKDQLSVEECKALYFDQKALLEPAKKLFRLNGYSGGRYYYSFDKDGDPVFYISVTNMIEQTMPTSPHLIKWIADMGHDESKDYANERADYGTFMHMLFQRLIINRKINFDAIDAELIDYLKINNHSPALFSQWIDDLKKDVLSVAAFIKEYKVKPLGIELMLASEEGFAGAVDLLCEMEIEQKGFFGEVYKSGDNKGNPKESKSSITITAIIDFKSGKKGFYENHEIQLEAYRRLVIENFPHLKDKNIGLFNFAPSDWRKSPTFKLKDQTGSRNIDKFSYLVAIAQIEMTKRESAIIRISGELSLDDDLTGSYQEINISTLVKTLSLPTEIRERDFIDEIIAHTDPLPIKKEKKSRKKKESIHDQVEKIVKENKPVKHARKNKKSAATDHQ